MSVRYIERLLHRGAGHLIATVIVLVLVTGCGSVKSTVTPLPASATRIALEPTHTPLPSTATPAPPNATRTPVLPPAEPTITAVATESAPTAAPTKLEKILFQSGHFQLVGDLQLPATDGKHPAIIIVHGDGGIDRYDSGKYRPLMTRFLRAGYAVFSWDKPGTGESTGEFVDGAWIITDRASILVDAVDLLKQHPAIDPQRIGVWGISQAGAVMPMALTMTDDIAFMIVVSGPGVNGIDQTAYLIGQKLLCEGYSEEDAKLAEQSFAGMCKATTYQEYRENMANLIQFPPILSFTGADIFPQEEWTPWDPNVDAFFNPMAVVETTTIPVLAFFGEKDTQVDPFQGAQAYEQALRKAGNQLSHVELVPGTDHNIVLSETGCMSERERRSRADWLKYAPEYLDLMEAWLIQLAAFLPPRTGSTGAGLAQIAFASERDGNLEIYIMNADGNDPRRLTHQAGEDYWPTWSPDGTQIAFASERDGNFEIYIMNADGSNQQRLTNNSGNDLEPAWSPDGTHIAFMVHSAGKSAIYVMDVDGSNRRQLTDSDGDDWLPAWSPDGTQIAFVSERHGNPEIYVMAADGSNQRRLTDNIGDDTYPAWSPEGAPGGQQISFFSVRNGNRDLYVMAPDGTNVRQLTHDDASVWVSAWSPDGTQLAFTSARDGNREIYVMDADGTNLRRLTNNHVLDGIPAWRPTAGSPRPLQPVLGDTWTRPADGMTMVYVPGGEFEMGSHKDAPAAVPDELPQHMVRLDGFWIDRTEVTNAQFIQFLNQQGNRDAQGARMIVLDQGYTQISQVGDQFVTTDAALDRPVVMVTWYGAAAYCEWAGARRPTEAEWEYAARGPGGNLYPWGNATPSGGLANYGTCVGVPVDVGSHSAGASWCGALDLAGNVWEWVNDWFGPYSALPQENPTGPASGDVPVLRGGGWHSPPWEVRAAYRQHELSAIGFNG